MLFFFFKQKTAYEMRISDWSSDVCSSDLSLGETPPSKPDAREFVHDPHRPVPTIGGAIASGAPVMEAGGFDQREGPDFFGSSVENGRASCRERVCQYV